MEESAYQEIKNPPINSGSTANPELSTGLINNNGLEKKLDELALKLDLFKEKSDGDIKNLDGKITSSVELRKWLTIGTVTAIGTFAAIVFGLISILNNSNESFRQMQDIYYQKLLEVRTDSDIKQQKSSNCLTQDSYWGYRNCISGQ